MEPSLKGLPINSYDFFSKLGLRQNVAIMFRTARGYSYRAQLYGKHTNPIKVNRCYIKITGRIDDHHYLAEASFSTAGSSSYYKDGDVFELFRVNHLLTTGQKIGDFLITGSICSYAYKFQRSVWCRQYFAIALMKE